MRCFTSLETFSLETAAPLNIRARAQSTLITLKDLASKVGWRPGSPPSFSVEMLARNTLRVPVLVNSPCCSFRIFYWGENTSPPHCPGYHEVHTVSGEVYPTPLQGKVARPFSELPGNWKTSWFNLYHFWRQGGFHNVHNIMMRKFQSYGPIYR